MINSNGSLDTSFDPGAGVDNLIYSMALQSDGKIIIGGVFSYYNGIARNSIARINTDGSLDTSFDPGDGADGAIKAIAIQHSGKILIGGYFNYYDGTAHNYIAILNPDGSPSTYAGGFGGVVNMILIY